MALVTKANPKRNFSQALVAMTQQILGLLDPTLQNVLVGRSSYAALKQADKVVGADLRDRG